jgi:hypothetical protein
VKLQLVRLTIAAIVFGFSGSAFADTIGYTVTLQYVQSLDAYGNPVMLTDTTADTGNGTVQHRIALNGAATKHQFEMYVSVHDLAADQDATFFQFGTQVSGGVTRTEGDYRASANSLIAIDPPAMGPAGNQSDMGNTAPWVINGMNGGGTVVWDVTTGNATGPGNGTYGDIAAAMVGTTIADFHGVGEGVPYDMGTLTLHTNNAVSPGTFNLTFTYKAGYFKVIGGNGGSDDLMGMGTSATSFYPVPYVGRGDTVQFVPEPGTITLLASGLMGLLCYAWRKRK